MKHADLEAQRFASLSRRERTLLTALICYCEMFFDDDQFGRLCTADFSC